MPNRQFMPFMPETTSYVMYLSFFIALIIHLYGLRKLADRIGGDYRKVVSQIYQVFSTDFRKQLSSVFNVILVQRRTNEEPAGKYFHTPFLYAFIALLIGTTLIGIEEDLLKKIADIEFLKGSFYILFELIMDTAGLLIIAGISLLLWRRTVSKPPYLHASQWDNSLLLLLLGIVLTGFFLEGFRIQLDPEKAVVTSYIGLFLQSVIPFGSDMEPILNLYRWLWFFHMTLSMVFIAILPYTKLRHILLIPLNCIVNPPRIGAEKAKLDTPFNILELEEEDNENEEGIGQIGIGSSEAFEWKERLQFTSCINCGRCEKNCPASNAGRLLSPRSVVQKVSSDILNGTTGNSFFDDMISTEEMWGCTNCYACIESCPAFIRHVDHFIDFRRHIVNTGFEDEDKITLLSNMERNGNPYGLPSYDRIKWLEDDPPSSIQEAESPEFLYFIGCSSCYNPRCQEITDAVIGILKDAAIKFGILGEEERCCGEPAKRIGEEGLFQMIAIENIELFNSYGAEKILVHCPHCYNMLKYEYRDFGGEYEVVHHTELIHQLIQEKRIHMEQPKQKVNISYHDPCNLGRLNGIYDFPRNILHKAGWLTELPNNREKSFCCGGGGGNAFFQVNEKKRISALRMDEAVEKKCDVLAAACPFCMIMFDDAGGNYDKDIKVPDLKDIAEIVMQHSSQKR